LVRRLGTTDAVVIGLGSMIGAGIFGVFGPAAQVAGPGLLLGLLIAAGVAYCNAVASAQLATAYPTSGGTYFYGRERLGPWWGFTAGWGFVVGKVASCAAMALTFAAYAVPGPQWTQRLTAVAAVLALSALNYRGIAKTAFVTRVLVALSLTSLAAVVIGVWASDPQHAASIEPAGWFDAGGVHGIFQAGGLIFFAFAGYARIATLGEEVRDPERTIPRAVQVALGLTVVVYATVAVTLLAALGPDGVATAAAPLAEAVDAGSGAGAVTVVRAGAAVAGLGALLALLAGVGRTTLAMARERDLPAWLDAVHPRYQVPHRAEVALAAVVCLLVLTVDLRGALGFSSFGVLLYYLVANVSAFTQPDRWRRFPRVLPVLGASGCIVLVLTLPPTAVLTGLVVLGLGVGYRLSRRRARAGGGRRLR
jgi:APA family basic amino acid/polyamine antiporter